MEVKNEYFDFIPHVRSAIMFPSPEGNMSSKKRTLPSAFTSAQDVYNNACVNWFHDPLELYATAYKEAAEKLVKDVITSRRQRDTLVYPIVFLYRHYIELRLKEIIRAGRKFLDEPGDFPKHHRVDELWPFAKGIIERVFENAEDKPDFEFVEHILAEFSRYDPESFSFRYPTSKKRQ